MDQNVGATGTAKNLVKALALLRILSEHPQGVTLAEAARLSGTPKTTAHRLLLVLAEAGMARDDDNGRYGLGSQCLVLGSAFLEGLDMRREAKGILEEVVSETGETCHLGIRELGHVVYIEKVESPQMVRMRSQVGLIAPLHSTALGKAILAYEEESEVEEVLSQELKRRTADTITDPSKLRDELAEIRKSGFAVDDLENEQSIRCVAAPVFDHGGVVVASISIAGPEYRIAPERLEDLGGVVGRAALKISRRLGYAADETGNRQKTESA